MSLEEKNKKWHLGFLDSIAHGSEYKKSESEESKNEIPEDVIADGKGLAILAYIPFLCFIPFLKGKKINPFAYEHGKQGVVLFLFEMLVLISMLFWKVALFIACVIAIIGVMNVIMGKTWKIPYLGEFVEKLD